MHVAVALSNHAHVVATDPRGVYPDFLRDFHGLLSRVVIPTLACRDKWRRIERLRQNKIVVKLHQAALIAFRSDLATLFPLGTWSMRFRASIQISTA